MPTANETTEEKPVYAHTIRVIVARMEREDRELVGGSLRRGRFRRQVGDEQGQRGPSTGRKVRDAQSRNAVNFHLPSPLVGRDRQGEKFRIPHFDMTPVTRAFSPTSTSGEVHHRYQARPMTSAEHFDYVTGGAVITLASHIDYIRRTTAVEDIEAGLIVDALDEQVLRERTNELAIYSNIPGGRERQRSFFEAVEREEREPKQHHLVASTASLEQWEFLSRLNAPDWVREMTDRLRRARAEAEQAAAVKGLEAKPFKAVIAEVTPEEAHERLTWFDQYPELGPSMIEWRQGRTGRVQYRFVAELPDGLGPGERHTILKTFCQSLADDGWMVVGAIHQPDPHANQRNYHIHVDGYDRPAAWLEEHGYWDFEYTERKNGRTVYPLRQNKVRYEGVPTGEGKTRKANVTAILRERYIDIVNEITGNRPAIVEYRHGTYAENGVDLTPLEHLGNRAIALEKLGIATDAGTRNARRIVEDELNACHKRAEKRHAELSSELLLVRRALSEGGDNSRLLQYEQLRRRSIDRRLQAELADVVVDMARSRADAVIAAASTGRGRRSTSGDLVAKAREHLAWMEAKVPTAAERAAENQRLAQIDRRAEAVWAGVMDQVVAVGEPSARDLTYRSIRGTDAATLRPVHRDYAMAMRGRLERWLDLHLGDPDKLVISNDGILLGAGVPKSIDTLMLRFAAENAIQQRLMEERRRRGKVARERAAAERRRSVELRPMLATDIASDPPDDAVAADAIKIPVISRRDARADAQSFTGHPGNEVESPTVKTSAATSRDTVPTANPKEQDGAVRQPGFVERRANRVSRPVLHKPARRRGNGLRPIAEVAGLRPLRQFGLGDRSEEAQGALPVLQRNSVRRGRQDDHQVRGAEPRSRALKPVERAPEDGRRAPRPGGRLAGLAKTLPPPAERTIAKGSLAEAPPVPGPRDRGR